jgi:hypothetical protein
MKRVQALVWLAAVLLPAACTTAQASASPLGTVTGRLVLEGGPAGLPHIRPVPGTAPAAGADTGQTAWRTSPP